MGRKHCVINVKKDTNGKFVYMVRDFPSLTGTFVKNVLVGKKEQVRIGEGSIVTIGATTFILHSEKKRNKYKKLQRLFPFMISIFNFGSE